MDVPTAVLDEPDRQTFIFRHKPPWCWLRLRELHLVASGQRPRRLQVLDQALRDELAPRAYENALGSLMAIRAFLSYQNLESMMEDLADFLESVGIEGLEPPMLSGMFGLEGIDLGRPGRTSTLDNPIGGSDERQQAA
jgi:hypothetical protein